MPGATREESTLRLESAKDQVSIMLRSLLSYVGCGFDRGRNVTVPRMDPIKKSHMSSLAAAVVA